MALSGATIAARGTVEELDFGSSLFTATLISNDDGPHTQTRRG